MSWIQTFTGKKYILTNPDPATVDIADIAQSLSMNCRYNGHVKRFYSVAEHSILMSEMVPREIALYALMHDAAEAYVTDLPTPLKQLVGNFAHLEALSMAAIWEHFDMEHPTIEISDAVKEADMRMLVTERAQLLNNTPSNVWAEWRVNGYEPYPLVIGGLPPSTAKIFFMNRFASLVGEKYFRAHSNRGISPV